MNSNSNNQKNKRVRACVNKLRQGVGLVCWVCLLCILGTGRVMAVAAGDWIDLRQSRLSTASSVLDFVPTGFRLIATKHADHFIVTTHNETQPHDLWVYVYENEQGRRALLVGYLEGASFRATGWGFVIPCRECGIDLASSDNFSIEIKADSIYITDRGYSKDEQMQTEARMRWRFDESLQDWRLVELRQQSEALSDKTVLLSSINYETGAVLDKTGVINLTTGRFEEKTKAVSQVAPEVIVLSELVLY